MKTKGGYIILPVFLASLLAGCSSTKQVALYEDDVYDTGKPGINVYSSTDSLNHDTATCYNAIDPYYYDNRYPYISSNYYPYYYASGYYPHHYWHGWGWWHHHNNENQQGMTYYGPRRNKITGRNNNTYEGPRREYSTKRIASGTAHSNPGSIRGGFGSTGSRSSISSAS